MLYINNNRDKYYHTKWHTLASEILISWKFETENFGTENIGPSGSKYLVCYKFGEGKRARTSKQRIGICDLTLLNFHEKIWSNPLLVRATRFFRSQQHMTLCCYRDSCLWISNLFSCITIKYTGSLEPPPSCNQTFDYKREGVKNW